MTYQEIVMTVREGFENADARRIFEHLAVQCDIVGEGAGSFYIEVADRMATVEPYDYVDRDGKLIADGQTLIDLAMNRLSWRDAIESGKLKWEGNKEKLKLLVEIKLKKPSKKSTKSSENK